MGEADRLGGVALDDRAAHERCRLRTEAADDRDPHGGGGAGNGGEPVRGKEPVPPLRVAGEPALERRPDRAEIGRPGRHGDDGNAERAVKTVEVDDVEAADDRPVEQDRPRARPAGEAAHERREDLRGVRSVDAHPPDPDRLDARRDGEQDGGDRRPSVPATERAVVQPDDVEVRLPERPPQRYDLRAAPADRMVGPAVSIRCPACGTPVRAVLAPYPPTQWLPCPTCHRPIPAVVPRDPPPLYTWEVQPELYPALRPPRVPRWSARRIAAGALFGVTLLAVVVAGLFGYYAVLAPEPGRFVASGTVDLTTPSGAVVPAVGATVTVTPETGPVRTTAAAADGTFSVAGLPTGGLAILVQAPGYSPVTVQAFVSTVFSAGATGIAVELARGTGANATTVALTPFPNLEQFVAAIAAGILVLLLVAGLAVYAALRTIRADRPALGIVGGGAGLFAPIALLDLSLASPFPLLLLAVGVGAGLGAVAIALRALQLLQSGPAAA